MKKYLVIIKIVSIWCCLVWRRCILEVNSSDCQWVYRNSPRSNRSIHRYISKVHQDFCSNLPSLSLVDFLQGHPALVSGIIQLYVSTKPEQAFSKSEQLLPEEVRKIKVTFQTGGIFWILFSYVLYSTLLHLPPLKFHCVGGCCDRTQDCCDIGIGSQTLWPLSQISSTLG
jgi:hypothetical protein